MADAKAKHREPNVEVDLRPYFASRSLPLAVPPSLSPSSLRFKQNESKLKRRGNQIFVSMLRRMAAGGSKCLQLELAMGHQWHSLFRDSEGCRQRASFSRPAVRALLSCSSSPDLRGRWKIVANLRSQNEEVCLTAVDDLRSLGKENLLKALRGGYEEMRSQILSALWANKSPRVRQRLLSLIQEFASDDDKEVIEVEIDAIRVRRPLTLDSTSCQHVKTVTLESEQLQLQDLLTAACSPSHALMLIRKRVHDDNADVRSAALMGLSASEWWKTLAPVRDQSAITAMVEALEEVNAEAFCTSLTHSCRNAMLEKLKSNFGEFDADGARVCDRQLMKNTLDVELAGRIHNIPELSDLLSASQQPLSWDEFRAALQAKQAEAWHPPLQVPSFFRLLWLLEQEASQYSIQSAACCLEPKINLCEDQKDFPRQALRCGMADGRTKFFAFVEDHLVQSLLKILLIA
eukprot:706816-Hanusia_phi.AAC.3